MGMIWIHQWKIALKTKLELNENNEVNPYQDKDDGTTHKEEGNESKDKEK